MPPGSGCVSLPRLQKFLLFFSLYLYFANLTTIGLGVDLLLLILMGVLCASWILISVSLPRLGEF